MKICGGEIATMQLDNFDLLLDFGGIALNATVVDLQLDPAVGAFFNFSARGIDFASPA